MMRRILPARRRTALRWSAVPVAGTILAVFGAGVASAYFSAPGSGTGSGSAGILQTVTLDATAGAPSTPLLPGGSGDAALRVNNPNSFAVTLVSVTGAGPITADSGHPGCTTTGVTFADQTGLSINIAPGGPKQLRLPGSVSMSAASSNGCQGATFSIPVTIQVRT
jgi:hypothetical protein